MQKQNITQTNSIQKQTLIKKFLIIRTHFDITAESTITAYFTQKNASYNI